MRRFILLLPFVLLSLVPASEAADDPVGRAMKLYERRHYAEAESILRAELPSLDQRKRAAAQLTLGMVLLKNGELHRAMFRESLALHLDYLQKLSSTPGKNRSRYVDLYLGQALLASGKPDVAVIHLEKFATGEGAEAQLRAEATAEAGLCYALKKDLAKADAAWSGLDRNDPVIKAALAAAFARAGLKDRKAAVLAEESLAELKKGAVPSLRHLQHVIAAQAWAGSPDKGLDLARKVDLKNFSFRESMSKTKIITFYDVSLLSDLAQLYLQASMAALEKASEDAKLRETAEFYLGEAHMLSGSLELSSKANALVINSGLPAQVRDKAMARQAAIQYQKGRQFEAIGVWDDLAKKRPEDPDVLAEILFSCARLRIDCPAVAQRSTTAVDAGEGKRYATLNVALGSYYLGRKDLGKGISYLESGRDKGNKNKIEWNDPLMLVNLAGGYYRTKKFSEALEIYFEMSRQFPEVRQLQEALQGIYAMEHKSAGDVKIN